MFWYFEIICICYLLARLIVKCKVKNRWTILDFLILFIMIFFAGFRDHVGTDYNTYYDIYNNIVTSKFNLQTFYNTHQEIGYYLLSTITKKIVKSDMGIFITSACLTYTLIYTRIKEESKGFSYSILLFFLLGIFTGPFNVLRQWIAIAINFYAEKYIDKQFKKFVVFNIIASMFHITALPVMMIQIIIKKLKLDYKVFVYLFLTLLIGVFIINNMPMIQSLAGKVNPRFVNYFNVYKCGMGTKLLLMLKIGVMLILLVYKYKVENERYILYYLVALIFNILGLYNVFIYRFSSYFEIYLILLFPELLSKFYKNERVVYKYIIFATFVCVFTLSLLFYGDLLPYKNYFGEVF